MSGQLERISDFLELLEISALNEDQLDFLTVGGSGGGTTPSFIVAY